MRVLVVESDRHAANRAITDLQAAGHRVVRCHEPDLPAFPCNALCDRGVCELEHDRGVDVVLDYRAHPYPHPTLFEDGVSCALRHHIPLVVAGTSALNPFHKWTTAIAEGDDVVGACEDAAATPIQSLCAVATAKARQLLASEPDIADAVDVVVTRQDGRLQATIVLPDGAREIEGALAVGVAGALRTLDRWTGRVDVSIQRRRDDKESLCRT